MAIQIDLHQLHSEEANEVIESIVNKTRMNERTEHVVFLTGRGYMQHLALSALRGFELAPYIPLSNSGTVEVDID